MDQPETAASEAGRTVEANGLQIYYESYGTAEAGPSLILLHGGTATLGSWQEHLPPFVDHFRVLALDGRGHGKTPNPAGTLSYQTMADDVAAFIEALGLERPLVFGYSDGGQIALDLGIRYPELCGALVLGGTTHRFPERYFAGLEGFGIRDPRTTPFDFRRMEEEAPDWVEYLKAEHARPDDPDYWMTLMEQIAVLWWDVEAYGVEQLRTITCPTLILSGDRDEGVDVEVAAEMYRAIPHSELAVLPNANHGQIGEIGRQIVVDFLLRHTAEG